ncbi:hypothetical protein BDK51DRAFT_37444 [Blyttiomyces helicus]|uniref:Uncharacterized protein n=1 Tax=Blyttiomyces helicus TaxID=388810 RepID=A0A4P9WE26_9FUNG|nr:hypothetical protein BDK51DRAFT_37444 [Blyttiomyces helicus]|eukprot:RKO90632.1 hypothetical protein BDK51DRAFT_37444 [Blyttiomyces helicus]
MHVTFSERQTQPSPSHFAPFRKSKPRSPRRMAKKTKRQPIATPKPNAGPLPASQPPPTPVPAKRAREDAGQTPVDSNPSAAPAPASKKRKVDGASRDRLKKVARGVSFSELALFDGNRLVVIGSSSCVPSTQVGPTRPPAHAIYIYLHNRPVKIPPGVEIGSICPSRRQGSPGARSAIVESVRVATANASQARGCEVPHDQRDALHEGKQGVCKALLGEPGAI